MKTKKKIIFWLIAILEIVGCFMLFYFVLSQIANCSDVFTPLMFSLISLMLVGVSSWILLSSVDESRFGHEKNLIFAWRNGKVLVVIAILLLILFVPSMILLQSSPSFWILLTIFPDLFMVFGTYWMYRWWLRVYDFQENFKKQSKVIKNSSERRRILFLGVKDGPKEIYTSMCAELKSAGHKVSLEFINPGHLVNYDLVILHGKQNLSDDILDSLHKRPKIIVIPNKKVLVDLWKDDVGQKQLVFVLGKDNAIATFVYAMFNTYKF